jgi:hypothetical protein
LPWLLVFYSHVNGVRSASSSTALLFALRLRIACCQKSGRYGSAEEFSSLHHVILQGVSHFSLWIAGGNTVSDGAGGLLTNTWHFGEIQVL